MKRKAFLADLVIGLVMSALVLRINWHNPMPWAQRLCDACFVPGVLLLGVGGIRYTGTKGLFDMMSYSIKHVFYTAFPGAAPMGQENEDLYEYKARKDEKRRDPWDLIWSGLIYMILALVFLGIYLATA